MKHLSILILAFVINSTSINIYAQSSKNSGTTDPVLVNRPFDQTAFLEIVVDAQEKSKAAKNDMQKGGVKSERDNGICAALKRSSISGWTGEISKLDSNSDGKGVLQIRITRDVHVQTWNNAFSDSSDKTLLEPSSALFKKVAQLNKGDKVVFSGSFIPMPNDCIKEQSLSLTGKLQRPEFTFRFSDVQPIESMVKKEVVVPQAAAPAPASGATATGATATATATATPATPAATAAATAAATGSATGEAPAPAPEAAANVLSAPSNYSPSFDCAKVTTGQERLICSDRAVSKLDVDLSVLYRKIYSQTASKDKFKSEQIEWLRYVRDACSDISCLDRAYKNRINILNEFKDEKSISLTPEIDGEWYSDRWKYGYSFKNSIGVATSTNSPNFKVGQQIIFLKKIENGKYEGTQVYTDGKFYKVTAFINANGELQFNGEKNAQWIMKKIN